MNNISKPLKLFGYNRLRKNHVIFIPELHLQTHGIFFAATKAIAIVRERIGFGTFCGHPYTRFLFFRIKAAFNDRVYGNRQIPVSRTMALINLPGVTSKEGL